MTQHHTAVVNLELLPAVAYSRPTDDTLRPLPDGYPADRMTIVRADQVRAGDLVVASADQPLRRGSRMCWATYLYAPYIAQPAPFEADCPSCKAWTSGAQGPWVTLYPHCPERMDALIAVIPADRPVETLPACVHSCACDNGRLRQTVRSFYPPAVCGTCHGRPCPDCRTTGRTTH
ncbi:hypothetical protein [Streptomyces sp. NBRC 110035]|uniref:hypothetical protein n=1 Tax=Streptomyces sp. NBRC 110035 TaxID=1547867 RepID=UPI0006969F2B|nr:hypothetical protein [Streptomyces sp. NBRC 110035]